MSRFRRLLTIKAKDSDGNLVVPEEIELLQTGEWNTPYHGHFVITRDDLEEYATHARDASIRRALPIDWEHDSIGGAAGWLGEGADYDYEVRANDFGGYSLWGSVKWTKKGKQSVEDDEYRFYSPEFADHDYEDPENVGRFFDNVMIGGGLTNRPLFKKLTAVAADDGTQKDLTGKHNNNIIYLSEEHKIMKLEDLLAKKVDELNAEEKAFIVEHKSELTDEQVTSLTDAGVLEKEGGSEDETPEEKEKREQAEADAKAKADADAAAAAAAAGGGDGDEPAGSKAAKDGKPVTMTASEAAKLREDAELGRQAHEQLARKASEEHIQSMLFNEKTGGKLPIAAKDEAINFYHGLTTAQRKAFDAIFDKMPSLKMFGELGDGGKPDASTAAGEVSEKAHKLIADDKSGKLTLGSAVRKVLASDKKLKERYDAEVAEQREGNK